MHYVSVYLLYMMSDRKRHSLCVHYSETEIKEHIFNKNYTTQHPALYRTILCSGKEKKNNKELQ